MSAAGTAGPPLLSVQGLEVRFGNHAPAVRGVDLTVLRGQTVAVVGESGSGKSTMAAAILGLLPPGGRITAGRIVFDGSDITRAVVSADRRVLRSIRGRCIGYVPQDPMTNPVSYTHLDVYKRQVLGSVSFAYVVRLTRSAVAANAHADYVRTATAKGLSRPRVVVLHILRNSLIPVVTFLGADLGSLMGGAIVTEGIFNIHGVGGVLYQAVTRQEAPTVVSIVTVLVLIYLISNLLVDLLYAALDPRIRYG